MPSDKAGRTSVVVLTLDAEPHLPALLRVLRNTQPRPARILFIDSMSSDRTAALIHEAGFDLTSIDRHAFGHGRTRNLALELCRDSDYVAFLTQDALPVGPAWLHDLLQALTGDVAVVYGRQLPRPGASASEGFSRAFNYPPSSCTTTLADISRRGVKAVFCSNSFAVYDRHRLVLVGGFPQDLPMGEDMAVTLRLLEAGFSRSYVAHAMATHSHDYTLLEEFRRYFDIGVLLDCDPGLRAARVAASSEGASAVSAEVRHAWQHGTSLAAAAVVLRSATKLAGYQLGRHYRVLPRALCRACSMHKQYWAVA